MNWAPEHDRVLIERYGKVPTRDVASAVGRTAGAVKQRARRLGLDAGRRHTPAEEEAVRSLYASRSAGEIALHLYGAAARVNRVRKIADKLGLRKWPSWTAEILDGVRALHSRGLTDAQVAREMSGEFAAGDDGRSQVRHIRLRLGLPANRGTEAAREAARQGVLSQLRTLGLRSPSDLRKRAHRSFAARYGLPVDLRPAQVWMVLALLHGPLTIPELSAAIGARPGSQLLHNAAKTSYQADLCNRGLVARIPTGAGGSTPGPRVRYLLTAACLDLLTSNPGSQP